MLVKPMVCPSRDLLSAFLEGKLEEAEIESWAPHVESCSECIAVLDQLQCGSELATRPAPRGVTETVSLALHAPLWHGLASLGILGEHQTSEFGPLAAAQFGGNPTAQQVAGFLLERGFVTSFQAAAIEQGEPQRLLLGEYVLIEPIGRGGMGQVYKARHRRMDRIVALKILRPDVVATTDAVKRFHREVRAAARLEHPNVVAAYDAGQSGETHFLVMQYVAGSDLASILRKRGPLPLGESISYMLQAARGLAYAHGEGVIHRDIKPSNMLVDGAGTLKVLDLGLAQFEPSVEADLHRRDVSELTGSGQVMGTVDYMSPEQAIDPRRADQRSDIYSLGCTWYRLLTGDVPYAAESAVEKIFAHRVAVVPQLRDRRDDIPPEIDEFCAAMMAKRPDDRPQSMGEVVERLEAWQTEFPFHHNKPSETPSVKPRSQRVSQGQRAASPARFNPAVWLSGAAAAVAVIALVITVKNLSDRGTNAPEPGAVNSMGGVDPRYQVADVFPENGIRRWLWPNGSNITLAFLNGDEATQQEIVRLANEWIEHANLTLTVVEKPEDAQIRIAITPGLRSWSYIGIDSLQMPSPQATMNLLPREGRTQARFEADVLQHVGHALGLAKEHQNPNAQIPWDVTATYAYYGENQGLSRPQVDQAILNRWHPRFYGFEKPFDPQSVLLSEFPALVMERDFPFTLNSQLSDGDKQLIARLYPQPESPQRAAAEDLLRAGAALWVHDGAESHRAYTISELPQGRFDVVSITCMDRPLPLEAYEIVAAEGKLKRLYLARCPTANDDFLRSLRGKVELQALSVVDAKVTSEGLLASDQLESIEEFYCSAHQLTEPVATRIAESGRLVWLGLYGPWSSSTLEQVARIRSLDVLQLGGGEESPDRFAALQPLVNLSGIAFEGVALSDEDVQAVVAHPSVHRLTFIQSTITPRRLEILRSHTRLTSLSFEQAGITLADVEQLREALPRTTLRWSGMVVQQAADEPSAE
jgi:serine/threonine protein kinase